MYNRETAAVYMLPRRQICPTCTTINEERDASRTGSCSQAKPPAPSPLYAVVVSSWIGCGKPKISYDGNKIHSPRAKIRGKIDAPPLLDAGCSSCARLTRCDAILGADGGGGGSGGAERRDDDREAERLDGSSCFRLRCFVHRPAQRKGEQGGELLEAWIWLQALLPSADPSAFRSATPVHLTKYMASVLASLNASAALLICLLQHH